jgi:hypothetical protein
LRIPRWCPRATLTINNEPPLTVSPGEEHCEIRREWKPGDTLTLDMPMPWRWIRGRKLQEGHAALVRGPVVYCLGAAANAELLQKYSDPRELTIDPASLSEPVADVSIRPHGHKVLAKAWPPGDRGQEGPSLDVVLTEFVDPSGIETYFRVPDLAEARSDELTAEE